MTASTSCFQVVNVRCPDAAPTQIAFDERLIDLRQVPPGLVLGRGPGQLQEAHVRRFSHAACASECPFSSSSDCDSTLVSP